MLDHKLRELADSDFYPFHMPGHKRQQTGLEDPYAIDITEIPGFDNLHDPQGLILEAMERMAGLYHAKKSYLLVGGSTCGNLTAVFSALPQKGCIGAATKVFIMLLGCGSAGSSIPIPR